MGPHVTIYEVLWGAAGLVFALGGAAALTREARIARAHAGVAPPAAPGAGVAPPAAPGAGVVLTTAPGAAVGLALVGARLHAMMAQPRSLWAALRAGELATVLAAPGLRIGGGLVLAGAFLLVCVPWASGRRLSGARVLDTLVPLAGLAIAIGRLGCFLAGCCFGVPTLVPWAVRYPHGSPAYWNHVAQGAIVEGGRASSLAVHPLSLYLGAAAGLASLVAIAAGRRVRQPGAAGLAFVVALCGSRLLLEPLRETRFQGGVPGQRALDLAFLVVALLGLALLVLRRRTQPPATAANGASSSRPGTPRR